jgi:hypothetical protein
MFKNDWCLVLDNQDLLDFHSQNWLVFDSCWSLVDYFRSMPSSMFYAFCFHFASTLHPVWIHFASCLLPASYCSLCGWDCFHVLMTNHHMPVSNMFPSTYTIIICCYCCEVCHHLPLPMYWPLGSDTSFSLISVVTPKHGLNTFTKRLPNALNVIKKSPNCYGGSRWWAIGPSCKA